MSIGIRQKFTIKKDIKGDLLMYVIPNSDVVAVKTLTEFLESEHYEYIRYWVSRYDTSRIETTEPLIYDAYNCVFEIRGDIAKLYFVVKTMKMRELVILQLEKCLGETIKCEEPKLDIKETATKMMNTLNFY